MNEQLITKDLAKIDLLLWQAEAEAVDSSDLYIWLRESGLQPEVAIRLKDLIGLTERVADKIINIGKIVLIKIIEFIKAHPNLATGIALGAAISTLVYSIPLIGTLLSPIALALGISVGAVMGHRMDKAQEGYIASHNLNTTTAIQDVIEIAREFFKLLIDVFNTLTDKTQD